MKATTGKPKTKDTKYREGIPCSPKSLKESEKTWQDMEDCFAGLNKSKRRRK